MPDVFHIVDAGEPYFVTAALEAAAALGLGRVCEPPPAGAWTLDALARAASVAPSHRVRALVDVLVAVGALVREGQAYRPGTRALPSPSSVGGTGWGALADVIRRDRPLPVPADTDADRKLHTHLATAGADAAAEVATMLGGSTRGGRHLVDLGGGMGAYTDAFLRAHGDARATLVDVPAIVALAREHLAVHGERVAFVADDIVDAHVEGASVALLSNVLHLHGPAMCERLVAIAAGAVEPGGVVAIKDLRVDDGRAGPLEGLLFAVNMALYTEGGDVYETAQLRAWLAAAGLVDIRERRLETSPNAVVMMGTRP